MGQGGQVCGDQTAMIRNCQLDIPQRAVPRMAESNGPENLAGRKSLGFAIRTRRGEARSAAVLARSISA
jgi:hypothetical protein